MLSFVPEKDPEHPPATGDSRTSSVPRHAEDDYAGERTRARAACHLPPGVPLTPGQNQRGRSRWSRQPSSPAAITPAANFQAQPGSTFFPRLASDQPAVQVPTGKLQVLTWTV